LLWKALRFVGVLQRIKVMKTKRIIYTGVIAFFAMLPVSLSANIENRIDSIETEEHYCLEITGRATTNNSKKSNYKAELLLWGEVVDSIYVKHNKRFTFNLKGNSEYAIRVSKEGYVARVINVSTFIDKPEDRGVFCRFSFSTELIHSSESEFLNAEALEFPIAIIYYDAQEGWFSYNKKYTERIDYLVNNKTSNRKGLHTKF
jgi:hypothetical protein